MRESLHQLTPTLALPIAVAAVWTLRGDPAGTVSRETANAYRVELAELPLPTRERLRTPGEVFDWRAPRVTPEDPIPRHRHPALPNQFPPPPVDLADPAGSQTAVAAPPSPREEPDLPGAVPRAPLPAPSGAPALVAAAPAAASRPRASAPKAVASRVPAQAPATGSAVPANGITGSPAAKTAAQTITVSSAAKAVAPSTSGTSSAQPRVQSSTSSSVARASVQSFTGSSLAKVSVQSSTRSSVAKTPVQKFTGSPVAKAPEQTSPWKSVVKETEPAVLQSASTPSRIAPLEAAPGLLRRDGGPTISSRPVSIPDRAWGFPSVLPSVADWVGIAESWHAPIESPNGHAPLMPPGQTENQAIGLSLMPESQVLSVELIDLPLQALASAAAPGFTDRAEDFSTPAFSFRWNTSWPTALLMIPEPGSALLLGAALAALGAARRRRPRA